MICAQLREKSAWIWIQKIVCILLFRSKMLDEAKLSTCVFTWHICILNIWNTIVHLYITRARTEAKSKTNLYCLYILHSQKYHFELVISFICAKEIQNVKEIKTLAFFSCKKSWEEQALYLEESREIKMDKLELNFPCCVLLDVKDFSIKERAIPT